MSSSSAASVANTSTAPALPPHAQVIQMLTVPGGLERTEEEYAALFGKAGFALSRVVPTASPVSVVEAKPV